MTQSRPNIVLIHTDQQRGDTLSIDGHPLLTTTNLDHLAFSGARFRRAYSECPTCIPARHALLTGVSPNASGVVGFGPKMRIARPEATLPELLKRAGYQTVHVGRGWHQYPGHAHYGFEINRGDPFAEYYSRFHDLPVPANTQHELKYQMLHGGLTMNGHKARSWEHPEEFHQTNYAVNRTVEFLGRRDRERPFFLSVGISAPHPPLAPPRDYLERYLSKEPDGPAIGSWATRPTNDGRGFSDQHGRQVLEGERLRETKAGYYGLIQHIDDQLEIVKMGLRGIGDEPVYVFFVSDHGEMLGDHYFWRKSMPYEGSARVPFLLSGPGIEEGTTVDEPVALQDILPTCCEIAGVSTPEHVTGRSLLERATGATSEPVREWLHAEHAPIGDQGPGWHVLVSERHKYIWFVDGTEQLFDLAEDPQELEDLSGRAELSSVVSSCRERLVSALAARPEGFSDGERLVPDRPYAYYNTLATVDT